MHTSLFHTLTITNIVIVLECCIYYSVLSPPFCCFSLFAYPAFLSFHPLSLLHLPGPKQLLSGVTHSSSSQIYFFHGFQISLCCLASKSFWATMPPFLCSTDGKGSRFVLSLLVLFCNYQYYYYYY
jgi:hypothetical protein